MQIKRGFFLIALLMAETSNCGGDNPTTDKPADPRAPRAPRAYACDLLPTETLAELDKEIAIEVQNDTYLPWIKSFFTTKKQMIDKVDLAVGSNTRYSRFIEQNGNWTLAPCTDTQKCDRDFEFSFTDGSEIHLDRDKDGDHPECRSISFTQPPNFYTITDSCYHNQGFWNTCNQPGTAISNQSIVTLGTWQSMTVAGGVSCSPAANPSSYFRTPFGERFEVEVDYPYGYKQLSIEIHTSSFNISFHQYKQDYKTEMMVDLQVNGRKTTALLADVNAQCPELLTNLSLRALDVRASFKKEGILFVSPEFDIKN